MKSIEPSTAERAYQQALRLLNGRDYTQRLLKEKLLGKGFEESHCDAAIHRLVTAGWLDDLRFAGRFAESAVSSGRYFGVRLRLEMKRRGFSEEAISDAFEKLPENGGEQESVRKVLEQRFKGFSYATATDKEKRRIAGFLQRKGFGLSVIFTVLKSE